MQYRRVPRIDYDISVAGFGCWSSAGYNWTDGSVDESIRAIHVAMDNGVNFFDVAPIYGFGESEMVVGKAIKGRRDKIFLATKCGLRWVEKDTDGINNLTKESILWEIDQSLKRLDVEYVDLLQMHWPDHNTPIDETMEAMYSLVKAGKIRYIGASNFSPELIEEADKIAPIASHQVLYNMFDRNSESYCNIPLDYRTEKEIVPQCLEKGIAMIPYSPLCQGVLSGRFYRGRDKDLKKGDMRLTNPAILGDELERKLDVVDKLKVIADEAGLTLLELAMGWLIANPAITTIIGGSRTAEQALTSAKAGDVVLSKDVLEAIDKVLPAQI